MEISSPFDALDSRSTPLSESDILRELEKWRNRPKTIEIHADLVGLHLRTAADGGLSSWNTRYGPWAIFSHGNGGRTEYPDKKDISVEMLSVWKGRADSAKHPVLRYRYADLAWDLCKLCGQKPEVKYALLAIDSAIEACEEEKFRNQVDALRAAQRAIELSKQINNPQKHAKALKALIEYEHSNAVDSLAGTWGASFDILLSGAELSQAQTDSIINSMEERLVRLADAKHPDPVSAEKASSLLAQWYEKTSRRSDIQRVLKKFEDVILSAASVNQAAFTVSWLDDAHALYESYGLTREADELVKKIRSHENKIPDELIAYQTSYAVEAEAVERYVNDVLNVGSAEDALLRLSFVFIPQQKDLIDRLEELKKIATFSSLVPRAIIDHSGRKVAVINSPDEDLDGNLASEMSLALQLPPSPLLLRKTIERGKSLGYFEAAQVMKHICQSPAFDSSKYCLIENGIRLFLDGEFAASVHLLVPQLEAAIRRLADLAGFRIDKRNRHTNLFELRLLHDLLRDERVENLLEKDVALYLRVLLVDRRGWNLRNHICHGMMDGDAFTELIGDRVFHAIVLLGSIRQKKSETA